MSDWYYKELKTPGTQKEFEQVAKNFSSEMARLLVSNSWDKEDEQNGTVMETHSIPESNILMTRCTRTFDDVSKFDKFSDDLLDSSLAKKQKIYPDMLENKVVREINNNTHVVLSQFKAPFPTGKREFVMLKFREVLENGSHVITSCSINFESVPFSSGFTRGIAKTAMLVTPLNEENKIKVVKIDFVDPKGWIPAFVLNWVKGKSIDAINKMQGYLD